MQLNRRRISFLAGLAALLGVVGGVAVGLIEDDPRVATPNSGGAKATALNEGTGERDGHGDADEPSGAMPPLESDPGGLEPGPSGPPPESAPEQQAAAAARGYIQALDRRAGGGVCRSFAPGSLRTLSFPVKRPTCAATVNASLGYRHRGGRPVWEHSVMTDAVSASVVGAKARVVATIFTKYADLREPTIEDDVIYLTRFGGRWLIAQPSATIHRAIGIADFPPSVLAPP